MTITHGKRYSIDSGKLEEILTMYLGGNFTVVDRSETIQFMLSARYNNDSEHQDWLDTAPVAEIAAWLVFCDEEATRELEEEFWARSY